MGKHVDRYSASKQETPVNAKAPKVDIEKMKPFKEVVERLSNLEITVQDIAEKLAGLKTENKTEE